MAQMGFYFNQTHCTGCYTCSVACKDWHDIPAGTVNWMQVKVIEKGKFPDVFVAYLASPCYHCAKPACALACPAGAIHKRESDGIVVVEREKCRGNEECKMLCRNACPWHVPQFGPEKAAKMQKCDLCLERLAEGKQPVCVESCPMYALDAGPLDVLRAKYDKTTAGAEGFTPSERLKPSVLFKPRRNTR